MRKNRDAIYWNGELVGYLEAWGAENWWHYGTYVSAGTQAEAQLFARLPVHPDPDADDDGTEDPPDNDQWIELLSPSGTRSWALLIYAPRDGYIEVRIWREPTPEELRRQLEAG